MTILYIIGVAVLLGLTIVVIRKIRTAFRFQVRLTVMMLLLSLVPTVPLVIFPATLLNRSLDVLVAGYLEETLESSLTAIREQMVRYNALVLDRLQSGSSLNDLIRLADQSSVDYAFRVRKNDEVGIDTIFTRNPEAVQRILLDDETIEMILYGNLGSILYQEDCIFESYRIDSDSTILVVGMPVDSTTAAAISNIEQASASYSWLRIFRDRLLDRHAVYAVSLVILIVLTAAVVIVASRLSGGIIRPIRDLVRGFEQVGDGNLDVTVNTKAKDEIEYLVTSFNRMVGELKSSQRRLIQSERLAAWRDVARQISHEIKNPLTPIQLSIHRLKNKISIPGEHKQAVEESFQTIDEEIESLRSIATEFSEFARMPKPQLVMANLNDVAAGAAALYEKNDRGVQVVTELDASMPENMLDPEQMKRVIINLIKNSIEAVPEGEGRVTVATRIESSQSGAAASMPVACLEVRDNGCGMDEDVLRKIFDPYFTTKKDGTGLGMPIIKRIVEEHSGGVFVDSEPGRGTAVRITLPANPGEPA